MIDRVTGLKMLETVQHITSGFVAGACLLLRSFASSVTKVQGSSLQVLEKALQEMGKLFRVALPSCWRSLTKRSQWQHQPW